MQAPAASLERPLEGVRNAQPERARAALRRRGRLERVTVETAPNRAAKVKNRTWKRIVSFFNFLIDPQTPLIFHFNLRNKNAFFLVRKA
jgi:hypothetical protein